MKSTVRTEIKWNNVINTLMLLLLVTLNISCWVYAVKVVKGFEGVCIDSHSFDAMGVMTISMISISWEVFLVSFFSWFGGLKAYKNSLETNEEMGGCLSFVTIWLILGFSAYLIVCPSFGMVFRDNRCLLDTDVIWWYIGGSIFAYISYIICAVVFVFYLIKFMMVLSAKFLDLY